MKAILFLEISHRKIISVILRSEEKWSSQHRQKEEGTRVTRELFE